MEYSKKPNNMYPVYTDTGNYNFSIFKNMKLPNDLHDEQKQDDVEITFAYLEQEYVLIRKKYVKEKVIELFTVKNNFYNGIYEVWCYLTNKLLHRLFYENNKKQGTEYIYYKNKIKSISNYVDNVLNGEYIEYYTDLEYENPDFINYCHRLDDDTELFPCNRIKIRANYLDGRLHGWYDEYHDNGNIKKNVNYIHGKKDGIMMEFYYDGNIKTKIKYENECVVNLKDIAIIGGMNIKKYLNY